MDNIYVSGEYLRSNVSWHAEDSHWKATQIMKMIKRNSVWANTCAEIGCGVGAILKSLSEFDEMKSAKFYGYDISPQAIARCKELEDERLRFYCEDMLSSETQRSFDLLLVIDVFEHVRDYLGFVERCREKANYKIFHIPLDIHVSAVARNSLLRTRASVGHLHYFTADSAIATLTDSGHEIVDQFYTNGSFDLFKSRPTIKRAIANCPRWLISKLSVPLAARLLGGYSLMVLTK